jgi:hypothetical protein
MTEPHKKRFFEHWIAEYCNRLDEVARNKKVAEAKLHEGSLKEMSLPGGNTIDIQPKPHARSVAETVAKTPLNRSNQ